MTAVAYLALFGAGVSTVAAPCVLPLLPAYITVVAEAAARGGRTALAGAGLAFVAGFTVVFVALGAVAGSVGGAALPQVAAARVGAVLLVVLGALVLVRPQGWGWPTVRLFPRTSRPASGASRWRPFAVGVAFAATWTPCVGPLLGAALVTAGAASDPVAGSGLLAAYSAGLAVPFLALCLVAGATGGTLPGPARRLGRHAVAVQRAAGAVLVLFGLLLAAGRPGWPGALPVGG